MFFETFKENGKKRMRKFKRELRKGGVKTIEE